MHLSDLRGYPPTWKGYIPGLEPLDNKIMHQWLTQNPDTFTRLYYNVRLQVEPPNIHETDPKLIAMWDELTARRVDAIGEGPSGRTLIEITARFQPANIGRVKAYMLLWPRFYPGEPITSVLMLYQRATTTELELCRQEGWTCEQVTDPEDHRNRL